MHLVLTSDLHRHAEAHAPACVDTHTLNAYLNICIHANGFQSDV